MCMSPTGRFNTGSLSITFMRDCNTLTCTNDFHVYMHIHLYSPVSIYTAFMVVCVCVLLRVVTDFNSNLAIPFWFGSESGKFSLNMSLVRSKALRLLQFVQYYV